MAAEYVVIGNSSSILKEIVVLFVEYVMFSPWDEFPAVKESS